MSFIADPDTVLQRSRGFVPVAPVATDKFKDKYKSAQVRGMHCSDYCILSYLWVGKNQCNVLVFCRLKYMKNLSLFLAHLSMKCSSELL